MARPAGDAKSDGMKRTIGLMLTTILCACAEQETALPDLRTLKGETREQIYAQYGAPTMRTENGITEVWAYTLRHGPFSFDIKSFAVGFDRTGRVVTVVTAGT
jgi:hypothetical protein